MKTFYLFLFLFSALIFSQVNVRKQLTDFNFDSRNPVFIQHPANIPWSTTELIFESVYNDSIIFISSLTYSEALDSFYQLTTITPFIDSNVIQRKATGQFVPNYEGMSYKILFWETNENGNWDIAFSIDSGSGWMPYELMFSSLEDENDPSIIIDPSYYNYEKQFQFLYSKGNSVYYCSKTDSLKNELIFEGNDSLKYSKPAGGYSGYDSNIYAVAVEEKRNEKPGLVYRIHDWSTNTWGEIKTVFDRAPSTNPKFVNPYYFETYLSFEVLTGRIKRTFLIHPADFGIPGTTIALMEDTDIETFDFSSFGMGIITEDPEEDFYTYFPFTFRFIRNDSTYVRVGTNEYYNYPYNDFNTKVTETKPALGPLATVWEGLVSYSVWEDSSNGKINLFGIKRIDPLGAVNDDSKSKKDFKLLQNYPNPFNPATTIHYSLSKRQSIILIVFDVLGREVATLVNEEKQPGVYEVEFDASQLSSGIYFYQLKVGSFFQTKKMVLLR